MKISAQNLGIALGQYLEQELAPQAEGLRRVALYMAIPILSGKAQEMATHYKPMLEALGMITPDGMLDLDVLYARTKDAMHKAGKTAAFGVIFSEEDVDKICALAKPLAQ